MIDAASGEFALERLEAGTVDVVLLDLMLPGVDGLTVCRVLQSRGDLPIIIITARSDTSDVIEGVEAGADDYMTKPLVASELAARIRALLRRRRPVGVNSIGSRVQVGELEVWLGEHHGGVLDEFDQSFVPVDYPRACRASRWTRRGCRTPPWLAACSVTHRKNDPAANS